MMDRLQPPDAVQEVALVDDHVKVDAAPLLTVVALAERVTAGADWVTETVVKILGAVTGGRHAKIGANAVVLRDVPAGATAIGVPAKITLK